MEALKAEADSRLTSSALDLLTIESHSVESGPNSVANSPSIAAATHNGTTNGVSTSTAVDALTKPSDDLFDLLSTPASTVPSTVNNAVNPFATAPFAPASTVNSAPFGASSDLWNSSTTTTASPFGGASFSASFGQPTQAPAAAFGQPTQPQAAPFGQPTQPPAAPFGAPTASFGQPATQAASTNLFASDAAFTQAFPSANAQLSTQPQSAPFDPFGAILQPAPAGSGAPVTATSNPAGNPFLEGSNNNQVMDQKLIKHDSLEASLVNLAGNLKINPGVGGGKMEWNRSPAIQKRTGGNDWAPMGPSSASVAPPAMAPAMAPAWGGAPAPARGFAPTTTPFAGPPAAAPFNPFGTADAHPTSIGPFGAPSVVPGAPSPNNPAAAPFGGPAHFNNSAPFGNAAPFGGPPAQGWGFQSGVAAGSRNSGNPF